MADVESKTFGKPSMEQSIRYLIDFINTGLKLHCLKSGNEDYNYEKQNDHMILLWGKLSQR